MKASWWCRAALIGLVMACSEPRSLDLQQEPHSARDSAGVTVITSSAAAALAPLPWVTEETAALRIGGLAATDAEVFGAVRGVHGFADGAVAVIDGEAAEVRLFRPTGVHEGTIGRRGRGPGEFESPWLVVSPPGDRLLVYDGPTRRFTEIGGDGTILAETTVWDFRGSGSRPPVGAAGDWMLINRRVLSMPTGVGLHREPVSLLWEHRHSGELREIRTVEIESSWVSEIPGSLAVREVPFVPRPVGAAHGNRALVTLGDAYRIAQYDLEGRLREVFQLDLPRTAVSDSDLETYLRWVAVRFGGPPLEESRTHYGDVPLPDSLPAFTSLLVDPDGCIFAQTYRIDGRDPADWVVFDATGRAQGTLTTPGNLEVHQIGRDFILGLSREEFGVESVVRHGLSRTGYTPSFCRGLDSTSENDE